MRWHHRTAGSGVLGRWIDTSTKSVSSAMRPCRSVSMSRCSRSRNAVGSAEV
ncbi:MAG: hypothetical protein Q8L55_11515 [Phycisphaerales bacterium]|nr:hypothetical protein [Phycisphaerales bacterium]